MTRKQYEGKMRVVCNNIRAYAKQNGEKPPKEQRIRRPKFGTIISLGRYSGQVLTSYEMAWGTMVDTLEGTGLLKNID